MAARDKQWEELRAKKGDPIRPKWNALLDKADDVRVGYGQAVKMLRIAERIVFSSNQETPKLRHPWKYHSVDSLNYARISIGSVAELTPFVNEETKLGQLPKEGEEELNPYPKVSPKKEGVSYLAIGVNIDNTVGSLAELGKTASFDTLRISEIDKLPDGLGSGGVLEDSEGWAWYPVVRLQWEDELVLRAFQIAMHNFGHFVKASKRTEGRRRHFFPPV